MTGKVMQAVGGFRPIRLRSILHDRVLQNAQRGSLFVARAEPAGDKDRPPSDGNSSAEPAGDILGVMLLNLPSAEWSSSG